MSGCESNLNPRRTASFRHIGVGSRLNTAEPLGAPVGANWAEFGCGPLRRGKAMLEGVLSIKHLLDSFHIGH